MVTFSLRSLIYSSILLASYLFTSPKVNAASIRSFVPLNRYVVDGAVAEIISASPDGNTLAYTNAGDQKIGFVDITDPKNPQPLGIVDVANLGEPTSVAITPDGRYAVAAILNIIDEKTQTIADQKPGTLLVIDLTTRAVVGQVTLQGVGPDSVSITPDGTKVIVAMEDEEDTDNLPGQRPGSINIVTINYSNPSQSNVTNVPLKLTGLAGVNYVNDPQPEYVAISRDGKTAAITLQENNAIAILDIASEKVTRIFGAGTSTHGKADLDANGDIRLNQAFTGRREPDSIAFTADGQYLVIANEGDTDQNSFGDGIYSGGRGWSILDLAGNVIYDSGSSVEELAVMRGHYPDNRSDKRGIEIEGATVASFGDQEFAFVASERGSFVVAYDISDVRNPQLVNFLPTGMSPEGVLAIPQRNLLLTANEGDGTIDMFQASTTTANLHTNRELLVRSNSLDLPFSALSGLQAVPGNPQQLYAIPDSAVAPSRIFTLDLNNSQAVVSRAMMITKQGESIAYDLEGIALNPTGGFWLVSEGDDREGKEKPNLLIKVNNRGEVEEEIPLPQAAAAVVTRFGFEGVTTNADGSKVYVAVQREMNNDPKNQVRIGEYDVARKTWNFYFYPLDTDNVDGWVGLSEIVRDTDGSFLVVERDNQGGANGATNARVKRLYRFSLDGVQPGSTVQKTLVTDLLDDYNWLEEKVEGMAVTNEGYWIVSDNDGGEMYTRLLLVPRP